MAGRFGGGAAASGAGTDFAYLQEMPTAIVAHAWDGAAAQIAFCPNDSTIHISERGGNPARPVPTFTEVATLAEHDAALVVTGIDWAPQTNRIATCSQDRNAYVWTFEGGQWRPTLVILRINRAATDIKWSPREDKFAVGSGARCVSVCYFEEENDWWVSKHVKRGIRSTITTLDWHPNNVLIATGSSDFKVRIFSGIVKGVDKKLRESPWGNDLSFGTCTAEIDVATLGWVHSVRFSPSGNGLAIASHNSSMTFAYTGGAPPFDVATIYTRDLPFRTCLWITENSVVAAGYDCCPVLFSFVGNEWKFVAKLDQKKERVQKATGGTAAAFQMFGQMSRMGTTDSSKTSTVLDTKHQNAITSLWATARDASGNVTEFSSVGLDGRLVLWKIPQLLQQIDGLQIV